MNATPYAKEGSLSVAEVEQNAAVLDALLVEYDVLRKEMDLYHQHQKEVINFAVIIVVGMFSVFGGLLTLDVTATQEIVFIFLLFPFVYTLLAMLYTDRTVRIIRIADYLHNYLRKKINIATTQRVMQWEFYKQTTRIFNRTLALILDRVRWMMFLLPSALAIGMFFMVHSGTLLSLEVVLIAFDAVTFFLSLMIMFVAEETTGIAQLPTVDLDQFE